MTENSNQNGIKRTSKSNFYTLGKTKRLWSRSIGWLMSEQDAKKKVILIIIEVKVIEKEIAPSG